MRARIGYNACKILFYLFYFDVKSSARKHFTFCVCICISGEYACVRGPLDYYTQSGRVPYGGITVFAGLVGRRIAVLCSNNLNICSRCGVCQAMTLFSDYLDLVRLFPFVSAVYPRPRDFRFREQGQSENKVMVEGWSKLLQQL